MVHHCAKMCFLGKAYSEKMKEENEASENRAKHLSELQEVTGDLSRNKTPSTSELRA